MGGAPPPTSHGGSSGGGPSAPMIAAQVAAVAALAIAFPPLSFSEGFLVGVNLAAPLAALASIFNDLTGGLFGGASHPYIPPPGHFAPVHPIFCEFIGLRHGLCGTQEAPEYPMGWIIRVGDLTPSATPNTTPTPPKIAAPRPTPRPSNPGCAGQKAGEAGTCYAKMDHDFSALGFALGLCKTYSRPLVGECAIGVCSALCPPTAMLEYQEGKECYQELTAPCE